jgi:hypothetical protein
LCEGQPVHKLDVLSEILRVTQAEAEWATDEGSTSPRSDASGVCLKSGIEQADVLLTRSDCADGRRTCQIGDDSEYPRWWYA